MPNSSSLRGGDRITVTITDVVFGGDGLARHEGLVVFVPFTAVGDEVEIEVTEGRSRHARGRVVRLVKPSAHRETPRCQYYQRCGGCQYQHLAYSEELRFKEAQIRDVFRRLGGLENPPVQPILRGPDDYGYRNRITVHAEEGKIGFHGVDPRRLVDIEQCAIARPDVNQALRALRERRPAPGHYSVRSPDIPPSGFFQTNQGLLVRLREIVAAAFPDGINLCLEAYAGGGFFTEAIADRFEHVVAIEKDPRLLLDLRRLGRANIESIEADVEQILPALLETNAQRSTAALLDPPREGLPDLVAQSLLDYPVRSLVYVSCDPATLARDLKKLRAGYALVSAQPIDVFPRTAQIECVTVLRREEKCV